MRKSAFSKLAFVALGLLVMVGLNSMRPINRNDTYRFKAELTKPTNEFVLDIAKCGPVKYYLQPNVTSVYVALQTEEAAKGNEAKADKATAPSKKYTYKVKNKQNISLFVSQNSKKGIWTEAKENAPLKLSRRGVPLNLEVEVPRGRVNRHDVANAQIALLEDGVEKTTIDLKVINSKY